MWHPDSIYDASGHVDEGVVHAWLDGELASGDVREVEGHTAECGVCAARVAEARGLLAGARRVLGALDAQAPVAPAIAASTLPASMPTNIPPRMRTTQRWTTRRVSLAAAAGLMFAAGSLVVSDRRDRGDATRRSAESVEASSAPGLPAVVAPMTPTTSAATAPAADASTRAPVGAAAIGASSARLIRQRDMSANKLPEQPSGAVAQAAPPAASPTPTLPPPPPPAPPVPAAMAQASPEPPTPTAIAGRIAGVATRSAASPERAPVRGTASGSAPTAEVASGVASTAGATDRAATRPDTVRRRRIGEGSVQLDAVVVTSGIGMESANKSAAQARTTRDDARLIGCWRIGVSDSVVLLDTLPNVSSLIASPRRPEPIFWRRVDSVRAIHIRPADRTAPDSSERVVHRGTLVRVTCP